MSDYSSPPPSPPIDLSAFNVVTATTYMWKVYDYTCFPANLTHPFKSSKFPDPSCHDNIQWSLELYQDDVNDEECSYISLFLVLESCYSAELNAKYKFSIMNSNGSELMKAAEVIRHFQLPYANSFGIENFIKRDEVIARLPHGIIDENHQDDTLLIYCEVSVIEPISDDEIDAASGGAAAANLLNFEIPECTLLNDFNKLVGNVQFSDIFLVAIDSREIAAHKDILGARCAVMTTLLANEDLFRLVTNIEYDVLKEMVLFIYTGTAPNLAKMADKLLAVAHRVRAS